MKRMAAKSLLTLFMVGATHLCLAQSAQVVDSLFFQGVAAYKNGRYAESLNMMEMLDSHYQNHRRTTGSLLMQGKALYKIGEYRRAISAFDRLIEDHPDSDYFDDGLYGLATSLYRIGMYRETVKKLFEVLDADQDRRLMRSAAKLTSEIMDSHLDDEQMEALLEETMSERGKAAVTLRLVQREIRRKHYQEGMRRIRDFMAWYPESQYGTQMQQMYSRAERLSRNTLKVGIILPLSGPYSEPGQGLLDGVQFAVDQHNPDAELKVELVVRDSEGDIIRAVKTAQDMCADEDIVAIIGELESNITAGIAAVAHERGVVLITPASTADGVTSIGPGVFQLNSSLSVRAETLAEYAVEGLGLERFAILYPADRYGRPMRDAFAEKVEQLGGELIVEKWYFEGAEDLGPQFKAIREAGIQRMVDDSLIVILPEETYDEMFPEEETSPVMQDTFFTKQIFTDLVDSTDLAVSSIDGLFLPVYTEDLSYVMPQLAFYNIAARLFGGVPWHDMELLEDNQRYIDGVIFLSDFYIDPANYQYFQLRDEFRGAIGKTPEKWEVFGYDTACMLLDVVGETSLPREDLRKRLEADHLFQGIRGPISLGSDRVNHSVRLLQYRGGRIIQIK